MNDSTMFPPQQGFAWRGDWKQRLHALLAARGFASVKEFAAAQPRKNFVDLANELGAADVAAVQLEWSYLDDAERLTGNSARGESDLRPSSFRMRRNDPVG